MDYTSGHMVKIVNELNYFTQKTMKENGIGSAEFDFVQFLRKNPGLTQAQVRDALKIDKGAAARRVANLEAKGYITREKNPADNRSQLLYATEKAESLRNSKADIELCYFDWLLESLSEEERTQFCDTLDSLYFRSMMEARAGFPQVSQRIKK